MMEIESFGHFRRRIYASGEVDLCGFSSAVKAPVKRQMGEG